MEWVIAKDRFKYDQAFDKLNPIDGKISGAGKRIVLFFVIGFSALHKSFGLSFKADGMMQVGLVL